MAIGVMPALEMAQESDKVSSWLKQEGEIVAKGEPLLEVEADKAVMDIESPGERIFSPVASGRKTSAAAPLAAVSAQVSTQPAAAADIRISRKARCLAGISSRCRRGDWQSGAVFRLSGAWVVYFAKTPASLIY